MTTPETTPAICQSSLIVYQVIADGEPVTSGVESIAVYFEANGIPGARIVLTDGDVNISNFELSSRQQFYPGKKIEIRVGYKLADVVVFKGLIIRHAIRNRNYPNQSLGGSNLVLECRHELVKASLSVVNKIFHNVSDSNLLSQLLKKYSSSVTVDATDFNFPELVQYQQSDWLFARQRAAANGFVIMPGPEKIFIGKPDLTQEPVMTLRYGETIWDLDAELDSQHQTDEVTFHSWDPFGQEIITASDNVRSESTEITEATGYSQSRIFHTGSVPEQVMKATADGQKHARNLSKKRGRVRCNGVGAIHIGDTVFLKGTGIAFDGKVLVTGIRHNITQGEWHTDLQFGLDAEENRSLANTAEQKNNPRGLLIGTVLQIERDPQSNERVLISIPMLNDREGIWARVATPDAGEGRGWTFWPEVDDEVIVGFLQSDPSHPVILGRLHSAKHPAPYPAENKNALKGIKTKSGMELFFDDTEKSISVKTPKGNILKVSDKDEGLELTDQNKNSIVLRKSGIEFTSSRDFIVKSKGDVKISAKKIDMQASTEVSMSGKTGLTLSSDVMSKLTGNPVKIN